MKLHLRPNALLATTIFMINSCSTDILGTVKKEAKSQIVLNYTYSTSELETMNLINDYRASDGLNRLEKINYISYKSEEHDYYMIANNVVDHYDFASRSENIMNVLGAKKVAENIAYNYNSPQAAFNAWLDSPSHKQNIIGDFTHFGFAIREKPKTGEKYYTNIFVKI